MTPLLGILLFGILTLWVPERWALTLFQVSLFVWAAVRVVRWLQSRELIRIPLLGCLLAASVAWGLLQVASDWTVDPVGTREATLDWMTRLVAFAVAFDVSRRADSQRSFLRATIYGAGVLALISIFTVLTSPAGILFWHFPADTDLPTLGPFVYRNQYAAFVEVILPMALVAAIRDRGSRMKYTVIVAILFGSVVLGGSRAGTLLCGAEIVAVPLVAWMHGMATRGLLIRTALGSALAALALTAIVGWEPLLNRMQEPHPYSMRLQFAKSTIAMIRDRPWFGFGLGTWSIAYPGYATFDDGLLANQAHNDWLQWTAEGGIPFLLILCAIVVATIRPAVQSVWGLGLLAVFVHGLVDYPMQQRPALAAFFFAVTGLLARADDLRRNAKLGIGLWPPL